MSIKSRGKASIILLLMLLAISGCSTISLVSMFVITPSPTITPSLVPCLDDPVVTLSTNVEHLKLGETATLNVKAVHVGVATIEVDLSSGAKFSYYEGDGKVSGQADDPMFAIKSIENQPDGSVRFVLRAKTLGKAIVYAGAHGEVGCYNTGYSWGIARPAVPVTLEITR